MLLAVNIPVLTFPLDVRVAVVTLPLETSESAVTDPVKVVAPTAAVIFWNASLIGFP
jgi:hypothetical protein